MLYQHPPYRILEGVAVFPDHADPLQYYFLPLAPRISVTKDGTGAPIPRFQLLEYRGRAGDGGFLELDVDVGVDQETLDDLARELQRLDRLPDRPRLGP